MIDGSGYFLKHLLRSFADPRSSIGCCTRRLGHLGRQCQSLRLQRRQQRLQLARILRQHRQTVGTTVEDGHRCHWPDLSQPSRPFSQLRLQLPAERVQGLCLFKRGCQVKVALRIDSLPRRRQRRRCFSQRSHQALGLLNFDGRRRRVRLLRELTQTSRDSRCVGRVGHEFGRTGSAIEQQRRTEQQRLGGLQPLFAIGNQIGGSLKQSGPAALCLALGLALRLPSLARLGSRSLDLAQQNLCVQCDAPSQRIGGNQAVTGGSICLDLQQLQGRQ